MALRAAANLLSNRVAQIPVVTLYLTERCNHRCVTCDYWRHGTAVMSVPDARQLAPQLRDLGTRTILMSGGEPLVNPRWAEICDVFAGFELQLATNGALLGKHLDAVADRFSAAFVSLDGATPATFRAVRGVDGPQGVVQAATALRDRGVAVTFRSVVQRANADEIPDLIALASSAGVPISFLPVDARSDDAFARQEAPDGSLLPDLEVLNAAVRRAVHLHASALDRGVVVGGAAALFRVLGHFSRGTERPRCNAPRYSAVIGARGEVRACHFLAPLGNSDDLKATLNNEPFRALRHDQTAGRLEACRGCVCPGYLGIRDLLRS